MVSKLSIGCVLCIIVYHIFLRLKSTSWISYIEALVNEFKGEEFIDMDTKYFDKQNIRLKAEDVGEKNLYGLYYDYDSSFEHGLWGAIRESSLLKCNNPAHKYHSGI